MNIGPAACISGKVKFKIKCNHVQGVTKCISYTLNISIGDLDKNIHSPIFFCLVNVKKTAQLLSL